MRRWPLALTPPALTLASALARSASRRWQSSRKALPSWVSVMRRVVRTSSLTPSRSSSASMRRPITAGATPSAWAAAVRLPLVGHGDEGFDLLEPVHGRQIMRTRRKDQTDFGALNAVAHSEYSREMESERPRTMPAPKAVLFDAYGTLFDVYSVALLAEQLFPGHGERIALLWRDKQIEYTRLVSMSGGQGQHYRPFWDLTRAGAALRRAAPGPDADAAAEDRLMNQYRHLQRLPGEPRGAAGAEARAASAPAS